MPNQMAERNGGSSRVSQYTGFFSLAFVLAASSAHAQDAVQPPVSGEDSLEAGEVPVPPPPPDSSLPEVETVISNEEFNQAIPPLDAETDPELDRRLETIEEFERRMAAGETGTEPEEGQTAPLGTPSLADDDAAEEIGDAPVRDAELTQPLPPIEQFAVEPVEFAEEEAASENVEVAYRVELSGLEEADKETDMDMRGMFNGLSALRDGGGEAVNVAMMSARLEDDSQLIQKILASEGWYNASVSTRIDRSDTESGQPLIAVIDVVPGKRYAFSEIIIDAPPTEPPDLIRDNLALKVGGPIVADRVQGAEAQVAVALSETGYPFVKVGQRDILLDRDMGEGTYTLPVEPGPRSRFGGFTTSGDPVFDAEHVEVLARFERGELYDSRMVDDLRKALVATSLFSTVSVTPERTGESVGDGTEYVNISVDQNAGPPRTIAGTAGYGTGEGIRVEGSWTHRNMFPPEGALIVNAVAGTSEQGLGVTFRRSNAGQRDRTFELGAEARHRNYDAFSAYTGRIGAQWRYTSTPIWQKTFTYAFGGELVASAEKDFDFAAGERRRRTFYIAALNGQVGLDFTDDLLNPTKGFRVTALIEPEGSLESGFNPYVRARLDASGYFPVGDSLVLAGRVRLGTIQGVDRFDIPPSRRFYSGGGGSVRGFGYQKLGPQDPNGDPIGGRSVNEAAAEVRYRFGDYGIVGFVDVGQSYVETMPQFSDLRVGVGLGGRFYTNFGPIRVDVATPLGRRPGEGRINVYVSIGQAF